MSSLQLPIISPADMHRDLELALHAAASLQATIRHADAKAQTLLGLQGSIAVVTLQQLSTLPSVEGSVLFAAVGVATICWLSCLVVTSSRLLAAISPRLTEPHKGNRFAFPAQRPPSALLQDQRNEAWDLVSCLAGIAVAKHSHIAQSLPGLVATSASAGALLATTIAAGLTA